MSVLMHMFMNVHENVAMPKKNVMVVFNSLYFPLFSDKSLFSHSCFFTDFDYINEIHIFGACSECCKDDQ